MKRTNDRSVFEVYAHEYDLMTNAAGREKAHGRELAALAKRFSPNSVLDAGCATGLSAMLFARMGIKAIGLDRSHRMLQVARKKFKNSDLPLSFVRGSFESLPERFDSSFDLVVCLANSISGVSSLQLLRKSLTSFRRVLRPGGTLVMQMLNFASIPATGLRPIRVTENDGIVYARYMERRGNRIAIHVDRIDLNSNPPTLEPFRHESDNFSPEELLVQLQSVGFNQIHKYANLFLTKRFSKSARDLVVTARR